MRYQIETAMAGIAAGVLGLTRGEGQAPVPVILERFATNLLFGADVAGFTSLGREQV